MNMYYAQVKKLKENRVRNVTARLTQKGINKANDIKSSDVELLLLFLSAARNSALPYNFRSTKNLFNYGYLIRNAQYALECVGVNPYTT